MTLRTSLAAITLTLAGLFIAPSVTAGQSQTDSPPSKTEIGEPEQWEQVPGVTRAAVLTAEGTVGLQFAAQPLREAIPLLKAEGIDLVVIKVNSGGGMLSEAMAISDLLHGEFEEEFEVVCWVDSAIHSAAAATVSIDSVVFRKKANWGGALVWGDFGGRAEQRAKAIEPYLEVLSERSGYPDFVLRAVFSSGPVSCDLDPETGKPIFRNDDRGMIALCGPGESLSLVSQSAASCGFSSGTADTLEELEDTVGSARQRIVWVGKEVDGIPFPVCKAEEHQRKYREEVHFQETRLDEVGIKYAMELDNARSVPVENRGGFLKRAEGHLARIKQMVKINPNLGLLNGLDDDWFAAQDEIIRNLRRG